MTLRADELDRIVADVRERFGSRLPPRPLPGEVEHTEQRRAREERTTWVLEQEVMVELNRERIDTGVRAFTDDDIDAVIQRVLDGIFAVEKLADAMRDADVENVMVKGAGPVRVEFASGRIEYRPPIAATDADLLAIIRDQALAGDRPFSYRVPYVDLQLPDGSRFHAEGFDIVDAPVVTIRRPRLVEVDLDELVGYGSIDPILSDVLTRAVRAGMVVVVSGLMNSGKTTLLRALCLSGIRPDEVIVTVETDFELGLHRVGRFEFVSAKQSRIPATADAAGDAFDCARLMELAVRNNAARVLVGEIRSSEAAAFVDGISVGRGAMSTVHGFSAADGLARIGRLMHRHHDVELATALDMLYSNVDLVVHVERSASGRYVREVIAPSVEGAMLKITPLWAPGPDRRAVPAGLLPAPLLERLLDDDPSFDHVGIQQPPRYRPLVRPVFAPAAVPACPRSPGRCSSARRPRSPCSWPARLPAHPRRRAPPPDAASTATRPAARWRVWPRVWRCSCSRAGSCWRLPPVWAQPCATGSSPHRGPGRSEPAWRPSPCGSRRSGMRCGPTPRCSRCCTAWRPTRPRPWPWPSGGSSAGDARACRCPMRWCCSPTTSPIPRPTSRSPRWSSPLSCRAGECASSSTSWRPRLGTRWRCASGSTASAPASTWPPKP